MAAGMPAPMVEFLDLPLTRSGRTSFDNYSVTATVTISQVSGGIDHQVGIQMYDPDAGKEVDCILADGSGSRLLWMFDDTDAALSKTVAFAWMNGVEYKLRMTRHGASYTCEVSGGGTSMNMTNASTVIPRNGANTNVWVYGATAQFGSVAVIGP
jgi:hypothetical protein